MALEVLPGKVVGALPPGNRHRGLRLARTHEAGRCGPGADSLRINRRCVFCSLLGING